MVGQNGFLDDAAQWWGKMDFLMMWHNGGAKFPPVLGLVKICWGDGFLTKIVTLKRCFFGGGCCFMLGYLEMSK
jgi:hypothetical protein